MTIPGAGGQVPPRADQQLIPAQPVPVSPGGQPVTRVTQVVVTPGSVLQGIFTYSSNPPAAGTLIESASVAAAGTDKYGNHFVTGHASYGAGFAASLNAGIIQFYTGSLAGGWTSVAEIEIDSSGDLFILAAAGRSVSTGSNTLDDGSGNMTVSGTLSVGGSTNTGACNNNLFGLTTSGPSAGTAHTHTLPFQNPTATHTHPL